MPHLKWFFEFGGLVLLAVIILSCKSETVQPGPPSAIITEINSSDTLGNPSTSFRSGDSFFLRTRITNNTGVAKGYSVTGPEFQIYIFRADTAVASQFWRVFFPQVMQYGVFPKDSVWTAVWKAPQSSQHNSHLPLRPGNYVGKVLISARFDSATVEGVDSVKLTITQ